MNAKPSYWLLSDDRLDLCKDPKNINLFRAHFKHAVLFNPDLIVPDSYIINNLNFRRSIRDDETFRDLMSDQVLKVATRKDEAGNYSLRKIRDGMIEGKKPDEFSMEEYCSDLELSLVDTSVQFLPFSIEDIASRYTERTFEIFLPENSGKILGDHAVCDQLNNMVVEEVERSGKLEYAFFYYKAKDYLSSSDWEKYRNIILDMAQANYLNNLPDLLGASPVYAKDHSGAFSIIKGGIEERLLHERSYEYTTKLSLASFVEGLSILNRDQILYLLDTDEAKNMLNLVNNPKNTDGYLVDLQNSLMLYQLKIEDKIIQSYPELRLYSTKTNNKIHNFFTESSSILSDSVTFLSTAVSSMAFISPLSILFTRPVQTVLKKLFGIQKFPDIDDRINLKARDELLDKYIKNDKGTVQAEGTLILEYQDTIYKSV